MDFKAKEFLYRKEMSLQFLYEKLLKSTEFNISFSN
jgi:hypothetical protein